jgi:hypothetical protein
VAYSDYNTAVAADSPLAREEFSSGGTAAGSVPFVGCPRARTFNGTSDSVALSAGGDSYYASWTVEFWAKASAQTNNAAVVTSGSTDTWPTTYSLFYVGEVTPLATVRVYLRGDVQVPYEDDSLVGVWHHYVYTYASGTMKLYIDGVNVATSSGLDTSGVKNQLNPFIFYAGGKAGAQFYKGDLAQVLFYASGGGAALSATRVQAHYDAAMLAPPISLTAVRPTAVNYSGKNPTQAFLPISLTAALATQAYSAPLPALAFLPISLSAACPTLSNSAYLPSTAFLPFSLSAALADFTVYSASAPDLFLSPLPISLSVTETPLLSISAPWPSDPVLGLPVPPVATMSYEAFPPVTDRITLTAVTATQTYTAYTAAIRRNYDLEALSDYLEAQALDDPVYTAPSTGDDGPLPSFGHTVVPLNLSPTPVASADWSVEFWAKPTGGTASAVVGITRFTSVNDPHNYKRSLFLGDTSGGGTPRPTLYWQDSRLPSQVPSYDNDALLDRWSHYTVTYSRLLGRLRLYVDKVLWAESIVPAVNYLATTTVSFGQGAYDHNGVVGTFAGELSQFAFFTEELAYEQVQDHFDAAFAGNPGPPTDLEVSATAMVSTLARPTLSGPQLAPVSLVPTRPQYHAELERLFASSSWTLYEMDDGDTVPPVAGYGAKTYRGVTQPVSVYTESPLLDRSDMDIVTLDNHFSGDYTVSFWARPARGQLSNVPITLRTNYPGAPFPLIKLLSVFLHVGEEGQYYVELGTAMVRSDYDHGFAMSTLGGGEQGEVYVSTKLLGFHAASLLVYTPGEEDEFGDFSPGTYSWAADETQDGRYRAHLPEVHYEELHGVPPQRGRLQDLHDPSLKSTWHHYVFVVRRPDPNNHHLSTYVDGVLKFSGRMYPGDTTNRVVEDDTVQLVRTPITSVEIAAPDAGWRQVYPTEWDAGVSDVPALDPAPGPLGPFTAAGGFPAVVRTRLDWQGYKGAVSQLAIGGNALTSSEVSDPAGRPAHGPTAADGRARPHHPRGPQPSAPPRGALHPTSRRAARGARTSRSHRGHPPRGGGHGPADGDRSHNVIYPGETVRIAARAQAWDGEVRDDQQVEYCVADVLDPATGVYLLESAELSYDPFSQQFEGYWTAPEPGKYRVVVSLQGTDQTLTVESRVIHVSSLVAAT